MRFDAIVELNPKVTLKKGECAPFVDMAALSQHGRDIFEVSEKPFKGSGSKFQNGDTLIARITPCLENGKGAMVHCLDEGRAAFGSTEFIVARAIRPSDQYFVYYVTRSEQFREIAIARMEGTSGRQRVSWQQLASIAIPKLTPEKREQIGFVLARLDDKIELNRKMSANLEEMARALYRSWFVDFDPVHAKAAGRAPIHMDAQTASLFPDSFGVDGLPEGWKTACVSDVFDVIMGQSPPSSTYNENGEGLPFFQGRTDFGFRFPTRRKFCTAPSRIAPRDSILLSVRAPVGDLNRVWEECCLGRGVASLSEKSRRNAYGYEALFALSEDLKSYDSEGTVFGVINKTQLAGLAIINPTELLKTTFEAEVRVMDAKIHNITAENQTLVALRDTLLPRLMSGQLRVGEAREQVEDRA